MFNLLKNKISGFIDSISKKVKGEGATEGPPAGKGEAPIERTENEEPALAREITREISEEMHVEPIKEIQKEIAPQSHVRDIPAVKGAPAIRVKETLIPEARQKIHLEPSERKVEIRETPKKEAEPAKPVQKTVTTIEERKKERHEVSHPKPTSQTITQKEPTAVEIRRLELKEMKQKEFSVAPSFMTRLKSVVMPEVTIKESDVSSVMEDFEMQLLTADVALPVAEEIAKGLKSRLVGSSVKSSQLDSHIKKAIYDTILDITKQEDFDIIKLAKTKDKPLRVLFIGPNGAGKTTMIAKFAHLLKKNGLTCVMAAADTFRAAAIEQTIEHAKRLDVPVIRHDYGSDPAAVAFDAVKYAKAKGIDVVLIDSAGRQETNRNLIEQLKKIERVAQPDLKIFVGEGIAGNAVLSQVSEFHKAIGLDGVILTKLDVDAKGGTVISIKKATGVPILYIGIGQGYDDLVPFDSSYVAKRIMAA